MKHTKLTLTLASSILILSTTNIFAEDLVENDIDTDVDTVELTIVDQENDGTDIVEAIDSNDTDEVVYILTAQSIQNIEKL